MNYPWRIDRQSTANGIVLIFRFHAHNQHFMAVDHPCHMGLGTADDDTLVILFHDVDEEIRVALLARPFAAVTFRVGHGSG